MLHSAGQYPTYNPDVFYSEELSTVIKPTFWSWEAAGLYHLSNEGGYRFSLVAGYRQELWRYLTTNGQDENSYLRDEFVSQSPFLRTPDCNVFSLVEGPV